ncbi:MAG TPA: 50S ribosomal protein L25/general stress protein Ctc [Kiloniellales bacterium]
MSTIATIPAEPRTGAGKGPARATRRAGRVPCVVYGAKQAPAMISIDPRELMRALRGGSFLATVFDVSVNGKTERVLPRDVQFDPLTDLPLHVDFLRVSPTTTVTVHIPVTFRNEAASPGLKRGGLLNVVRHEIEAHCRADAIPHHIEVDLTGLDIGDSVHISMIALPEGVRPAITGRDFTIATIAAPTVVQEEATAVAAEAAPVEGEEVEVPEGEEKEEGKAEEKSAED